MRELRIEIVEGDKKFQKQVVLPEGTYDDRGIQETEVLEAFREISDAADTAKRES